MSENDAAGILPLFEDGSAVPGPSDDNVTDWCLGEFRERYRDLSITKDAIWE